MQSSLFSDIPSFSTWKSIQKIEKGWSSDQKYLIETIFGKKLLLRISDISKYEAKKREFESLQNYNTLDFTMSKAIAFGTCLNDHKVYMILSWIEGSDLESTLPTLSESEQYLLGKKAGSILKKIHSLPVPISKIPKEGKYRKKLRQLGLYEESSVRISGDEQAIQFARDHLAQLKQRPYVYQHGDFHPGNLILLNNHEIGVIDFNRWGISDPFEEFYKLETLTTEISIPYCIGQIHSYFDNHVPMDFWEILKIYVAHAALYSIKWAEPFGKNDINRMTKRCRSTFLHYNDFTSTIPNWYNDDPIPNKGENL